jgi:DNA-binding transcriptional LysR family regulator
MTLQQLKYVTAIADCGSLNEAAKRLFVSQPSLSSSIRELEKEIGIEIFQRSNRGVIPTPEGGEFLGYARQVYAQYELIENRYISKKAKHKFSVSAQHYTFAVKAFVELVKRVGMDDYEFAVYETKTFEIIEDVRDYKSEIGILYLDDFNEKVLTKLIRENNLEFTELFRCPTYVFLWRGHPLAGEREITMAQLADYPCLSFDQGTNNSFYLAEEVMSTYDYRRRIKTSDRATVLNLSVGLCGYTLCSGIICQELNGPEYTAVPLRDGGEMRIGYIKRAGTAMSELGGIYIEEIRKCGAGQNGI